MKILSVCNLGQNRSRYLAQWLLEKGHETDYGGIDPFGVKPLIQKQVDWADIIIVVKPHIHDKLKLNYNISQKKIITLDVSDAPEDYPEEAQKFAILSPQDFQKEYVYKELRKQLLPFMHKYNI